jgi:hypothetical protein
VEDDPAFQVFQLIRRVSSDAELLEEVVALIERRTAELDERDRGAAPRAAESVEAAGKTAITLIVKMPNQKYRSNPV